MSLLQTPLNAVKVCSIESVLAIGSDHKILCARLALLGVMLIVTVWRLLADAHGDMGGKRDGGDSAPLEVNPSSSI